MNNAAEHYVHCTVHSGSVLRALVFRQKLPVQLRTLLSCESRDKKVLQSTPLSPATLPLKPLVLHSHIFSDISLRVLVLFTCLALRLCLSGVPSVCLSVLCLCRDFTGSGM